MKSANKQMKTARAADSYAVLVIKVNQQMIALQNKIDTHREQFVKEGMRNWGYVGDLGYVTSRLAEIEEFLGSSEK